MQLFPEGYRWLPSLADEPQAVPADATTRGAVLIVTPEQARELLKRPPAGKFVIVLWLAGNARPQETLLHHPLIAGVLADDCSPATVYTVLKSALALAEQQAAPNAEKMLTAVLEVGRALASEKNREELFHLILTHARTLTVADGASIYTVDADGVLRFRVWQNASKEDTAGTAATNPDAAASANGASDEGVAVGADSIAGFVARTGAPLAIADAYALPADAPYRFNDEFDRRDNYRTVSLLTVPLKGHNDTVLGVLQLINRKQRADVRLDSPAACTHNAVPFHALDLTIAQALAGQAGVALENSVLYRDIERLFEGFVTASVRAIEARDPVTAGHSFRVAEFTERLAIAVDRADAGALASARFSRDELRELRYAALLHDFGKVGVREDLLRKSKKLFPAQLEIIRQRFKYARATKRAQVYRELMELYAAHDAAAPATRVARERELAAELDKLTRYWDSVTCANEPTVVPLAISADLGDVAAYRFLDDDEGGEQPLLRDFEFADLSVAKGSLSAGERREIESHVNHTYSFLRLIPWTADLNRLADIAYAHHEKLDGSGYPRGLVAADIPLQARMMAIADIFDALTAGDRPYKQAVPLDKALDILRAEASQGKIDAILLDVFIGAHAYRLPMPAA